METISREEAAALGYKRYFSGVACRHGHVEERLVGSNKCLACHRAAARKQYKNRSADPIYRSRHNERGYLWKKKHRSKVSAQNRKWHAAHPEKNAEYCRNWQQNNQAKVLKMQRKWRAANAEKAREAVRQWTKRNPERAHSVARASKINRRAKEKANGGRSSADDIDRLFLLQKGRCAACLRANRLTVDHIVSIANGGSSDPSNLQLLCFPCNRSKSKRDPIEWAQSRERLL